MQVNADYAFLGNGLGVTRTHRGDRFFVLTDDLGLSPHIIMDGVWEQAIEKSIISLIKEGDTVVEVGCNMGYHTLAMCHKIGKSGRLFGFEANPQVFDVLSLNVEYNDFKSVANIYNLAASDQSGTVSLGFRRSRIGSGTIIPGKEFDDATDVLAVPAMRIDDVLDNVNEISLLRMDAEGAEPLIINGAAALMSRSPNMRIVMEWSVEFMRGATDVAAFVAELEKMNFKVWRIDGERVFTPLPFSELINLPHCEVAFSKDNLNPAAGVNMTDTVDSVKLQAPKHTMNLPPRREDMLCKLCGAHASFKFGLPYNKKSTHPIPDEPDDCWYYQCDNCNFLFTDAIDYQKDHTEIYDDTYWENQDPDWYGRVSETFRLCALANELLQTRLDQAEILDFGCGIGGFIDMGRRSLNLNVWGTDIIPPKVGKDFFLPDLDGRKFDIITSCEVIEHLSNPRTIFDFIKSHLKSPGVFAFQTAQWDPGSLGRDWWYLGPHNGHISLYSREGFDHVFKEMGGVKRRLWNDYPGVQAWLFN